MTISRRLLKNWDPELSCHRCNKATRGRNQREPRTQTVQRHLHRPCDSSFHHVAAATADVGERATSRKDTTERRCLLLPPVERGTRLVATPPLQTTSRTLISKRPNPRCGCCPALRGEQPRSLLGAANHRGLSDSPAARLAREPSKPMLLWNPSAAAADDLSARD